jgi:cysteine-S-conjugate beta-lyase
MAINFDEILDRRCTECFKWNYFDPDVLPMWVADMDFKAPPAVIQALQNRVAHGVFGYVGEAKELQALIADRMFTRYRWKVDPEAVVFIPGVITGFNLACHTFARPDGEVLIQTPVYFPFFNAPGYAGMRRVDNSLQQNADLAYCIDFEAFEAAITKQTALFILCNPHNPVGRVFRRDELERMAEICLKHQVPICSDEIHCDLVFNGHRHIPLASLDPEIERRTITLIAPSKTFNIAGLECSAAIIADSELRKRYQEASKGLTGGVNLLGLTAGLAAYQDGQAWLEELLAYLEGNRDFMMGFIQEWMPEIKMTPVEATYLAWLDCRAAGLGEKPAEFFLEHGRVGLNEGAIFGKEGEGFVRLNFGCPRSLLVNGLERMVKSLGER